MQMLMNGTLQTPSARMSTSITLHLVITKIHSAQKNNWNLLITLIHSVHSDRERKQNFSMK